MKIEKKEGFRIIKFFFSMQGDYEIVQTNAPDSLIMAQLVYTNEREVAGEYVESNYDIIEAMGFQVEVIGGHNDVCMDDFDDDLIDEYFDYFDYYISEV